MPPSSLVALLFLSFSLSLYLYLMPPFHSSRRERPRSLPRFLPARAPFPLLPLPLRLCLEMWHSTGLPRCLRWCGIRAGLPLRARPGGAGVPRGNDAQIGRIISKTTTLPPSSPPSPLPPSYLSHPAALSRLVLYVPRALSPLLSRTLVADGRQGMEYNPHRRSHRHRCRHRTITQQPSRLPRSRRRRVTESSDYYLICRDDQRHACRTVRPSTSRIHRSHNHPG